MTVKEVIGATGSWELRLTEQTPDEIVGKLGLFGHVAIVRGRVDVEAASSSLLAKARYVGILRKKGKSDDRTIGGPGMVAWLGDEDEKGQVIENKLTFTAQPIATVVPFFIPSSLTLGTIYPLADTTLRYTGSHQFETQRSALTTICDFFGVEFRVNGNGTVDIGRQDQLYTSVPDSIVVRRGAGTDLDLVALGGSFDVEEDGQDYSTRILLLGSKIGTGTTPDQVFAAASASAATVPYLDLQGNPVVRTRMISDSNVVAGQMLPRAQLHLNRFNRTTKALKVTAQDFEMSGNFRCGDNSYVYDPDTGIVSAANQVDFRGQILHPDIVRITEITWPISDAHTVAFRTGTGEWIDLTRYVVFESGTTDLVVGDVAKALIPSSGNPIQDRANAGVGSKAAPKTPTGLTLATSSTVTPRGTNEAVVTVSWTAPTQNADNTALTDLDHYVVRYRWTGRAPKWEYALTSDVTIDVPVGIDLDYEVAVAAVDSTGSYSPYTATSTIRTAADSVAPPAPADPVVSNYLGQLKIEYTGTAAGGGAMPADTNRVDVHVSSVNGFTPSVANRVSSLNPFARGIAYANTAYSVTQYVRLVAYDHTGNVSASSAQVSGASSWIGTFDIANLAITDALIANLSVGKLTAGTMTADVAVSGRFATALTGARREMNAAGFQAFDASNSMLINFDGVNNLLVGKFRTALSGRRAELYNLGTSISRLNFFADDETLTEIAAYTSGGIECLKLSIPNTGTAQMWNAFQMQQNEYAYMASNTTTIYFGGYSSGSGAFRVDYAFDRGTPSTYPTTTSRLYIDYTVAGMTVGHGGEFYINEILANASQIYRLRMTTSETSWSWEGSNSHAYVRKDDGTSRSAGFATMHPTAGYGMSLTYVAASGDGVTSRRLEVKDINDSTFMPISAGAYTNASARAGKDNIADLGADALAVVRAMRVREYEWKPPVDADGKPAVEVSRRTQVGLIAEEAPAEVLVRDQDGAPHGVDLYAMISLLAAAVQQLDQRGKP